MVLNPKMLLDSLQESDQKASDEAEKYLDRQLAIHFTGHKYTKFWSDKDYNSRVQVELRKRYMAAGWKDLSFKYSNDPRDRNDGGVQIIFEM